MSHTMHFLSGQNPNFGSRSQLPNPFEPDDEISNGLSV